MAHPADPTPTIDVHEASRRIADGARLIDCREADEFARSRIPGAVLVPLSDFAAQVDAALTPGVDVLVQCRSGVRSARATDYLRNRGVNAFNVAGGILAWAEAGLPVEEADQA
jgi:rhodanese-related sulfurtransferase